MHDAAYPAEFLAELDQGWNAPFSGWDFHWMDGKYTEQPPAWDYLAMARERMQGIQAVLDMDTGGGELFSALGPFPPVAFATENWEPNIPIARTRLEPLGVRVVAPERDDHMPFEDASFDLVLNRHGSYPPADLWRILKPGGLFLTQQVGGQNQMRLNQLLQDEVAFEYSDWTLARAAQELRQAGFHIVQAREDFPPAVFYRLSAVVYYLRVISWQVDGFEPGKYIQRLYQVYRMIQRDGHLQTAEHRFLIEARKP